MRRFLNLFYDFCGLLAVIGLVAIALVMLIQVLGREVGFLLRGADDIVAFLTAASAFLGLAHTFREGDLIRMGAIIESLGPRGRRLAELYSLVIAAGLTGWFSWWTVNMTIETWQFDEVAPGLLRIPLWIPQTSLAIGGIALFVAVLDDLVRVLSGDEPEYERAAAERRARGEFPAEGGI